MKFVAVVQALLIASMQRVSCYNDTDVFSVAAYLPEWRYQGANYDKICQYTSHLIFFSVEPSNDGEIVGFDRFPSPEILSDAKAAAKKHGCKLLICFGGNGRSSGFSATVRQKKKRSTFAKNIITLLDKYGFDGIDLNWEYPGYTFGKGYGTDKEIQKDYFGLIELIKVLREKLGSRKVITLAYYPDKRQEALLLQGGVLPYIDLMHMMTYDKNGGHHSPFELATSSVSQAIDIGLDPKKITLGLPFYGRNSKTGDWTTYEDLVNKHVIEAKDDKIAVDKKEFIGFNGIDTITKKVNYAIDRNIGGVMIWEVGQDCRLEAVSRGDQTHAMTCPKGEDSSLLIAISRAVKKQGLKMVVPTPEQDIKIDL